MIWSVSGETERPWNRKVCKGFAKGSDMKMKKRVIFVALAAVLLVLMVFGGIEIYKYNTLCYRIGIARTNDGRIAHPVLITGANSYFGVSKKAVKKSEEIMQEWREKVGSVLLDITLGYSEDKNHTLDVEYRVVDGKTEVHLFGEGIPNGETEKRKMDETVLLDYAFELDKDVIY